MNQQKVIVLSSETPSEDENLETIYPLDDIMDSDYCRENEACVEKKIRILANSPALKNLKWISEV